MKKRCAFVLIPAMLLALTIPAFAAENPGVDNSRQITESSAQRTEAETAENGLLSINKQILPAGAENEFNVQLDVTTAENLKDMVVKEGSAAVLIIVDKSSSMNQYSVILPDKKGLAEVIEEFKLPSNTQFPTYANWDEKNHSLTEVDAFLAELFPAPAPVDEVSQNQAETPQVSPEPSASPEPQASPEPSTTPEPEVSPEPSTTPEPQASPEPSASPEPQVSPEPSASPEPQVSPDPSTSPKPQEEDNIELMDADIVPVDNKAIDKEKLRQAVYDCYHRRAWFEREAVKDFLDSYAAGADEVDRYFSLGTFHKDASIKCDWTMLDSKWWSNSEVALAAEDYKYSWAENWNSQAQNEKEYIGPLVYTNGNGSNLEGAYLLARNMMAIGFDKDYGCYKDAGIENLQVIIVTDGEPTAYVKESFRNFDMTANAVSAPGLTVSTYNADGSIDSYRLVGGAKIEGIHFKDSKDVKEYNQDIYDRIKSVVKENSFVLNVVDYGKATLGNSIYNDNTLYYDNHTLVSSESISDLGMSDAFRTVIPPITTKTLPWTVTDPMGAYIRYNGPVSGDPALRFDESANTLTWDLTKSEPMDTETVGGEGEQTTLYHYRLTYPVTLDNRAEGFVSGQSYDANGKTTLTYTVTRISDATITDTDTRHIDFDLPAVEGYLADVEISKTDGYGLPLAGAQFTLTETGGGKTWTAVSDETGLVRFAGIPSGFSYTCTETAAPNGYQANGDVYSVLVQFGQVLFGTEGAESLTVRNLPISDGSYVPPPSPPPTVEIPEETPPLADQPETDDPPLTEIPEEEVPLDGSPKTGDSARPLALAALLALSACTVALINRRKESV